MEQTVVGLAGSKAASFDQLARDQDAALLVSKSVLLLATALIGRPEECGYSKEAESHEP